MAASITFVSGRAGAGKSRYLRWAIAKGREAGRECALIVPEQFTFEAEKELSEKLPGGLMRVEVYSFTSLSSKILREAGEHTTFLTAQGRYMVIRRAAEENKSKLRAFAGVYERPGFAAKCDDLFSLCKRCDTEPRELREIAEKLPEDLLGLKMRDLALLYESSENALAGKYIRAEDALGRVISHIPESFLRAQDIYVDNCDFWAEQIYGMIGAMMDCASSLCFCVRADPDKACRDRRVFTTEYRACERLLAMAKEKHCEIEYVDLPQKDAPWGERRYNDPALAFLEGELFAEPPRVYPEKTEAIRILAATDLPAEAEAAADAVQRAAREGMRYREMAVVACDLPSYAGAVRRAFDRRGIPCFTDAKHPLGRYALSRLLCAALEAVSRGWGAKDMIALCKTGLAGVEREDCEIFENYVLKNGIRGNAFTRPFIRGEVPPEAEETRKTLAEPLLILKNALKEAPTAREKTEALYAYMDSLEVRAQTETMCAMLREEGNISAAEENRQVYETFMELFSQIHALMGDTPLSTERFYSLLREGISAYEIGVIPSTADQVLLGSIDRTRARSVRALFLLGAAEGALPQSVRDDALIDDGELSRLSSAGMRTWDDSQTHVAIARMDAYLALTKPSELLYISFQSSGDGAPSPLVDRTLAVFPGIKVESDLTGGGEIDAQGGFVRLCSQLRAFADGAEEPDASLYAWYANSPDYSQRLERVTRALFPRAGGERIKPASAALLYGGDGSASRLETFNACPFKHFAKYGLRARERAQYGEKRVDQGSFCHEALALYADALARRRDEAKDMDRETVDSMLADILPPLLKTHNGGVLEESARMGALGKALCQRVRATAWAVTRQLAAGEFKVKGTEISFGRGQALPALSFEAGGISYSLSGKIDRLDEFESGADKYYRVIDYKSGGEDFDFAEVYYGLKLQLPLYIAAATALDEGTAAGIYYLPIDDPAVDEDKELEAALMESFRMRGITLRDALVEKASDAEGIGVLPKDGGRSDGGRVSPELMRRLMDYAAQKSRETARRMNAGDIEAHPVMREKVKRAECAYCEYASLCRFDRRISGCAYKRVSAMKAEEFMETTDGGKMDDTAK